MSAANLHLYKIDTLNARLLVFCNNAAGEEYSKQNGGDSVQSYTIIVSYKYLIFFQLCQIQICRFGSTHRFNMELDLQSLFGLLCTAVLIG